MKPKFVFVFLTLFILTGALSAAPDSPAPVDENPYHSRRHAIGIQASSIAGIGIDYKYALADILHWRITGMAFPARSGNVSYTFSNIGTDLQINLFQNSISQNLFFRTYVAPAISYWQTSYSDGYSIPSIHAGATLGFELVIASRVNLHGDLGFGYYSYDKGQSYYTTLAGGVGIGILF